MPTFDGIDYPGNLDDALGDASIAPLLRKFLDKRANTEIHKFWDVMQKKIDPKSQYKVFFAKSGKFALNLEYKTLADAQRLGEAQDWKSKDWKQIYRAADIEIYNLAGEPIMLFYKNDPEFKKLHALKLEHVMYKKVPKQLLVDLNATDKKAVANVAALLKADKRAGEKALKLFSQKNKKAPPPKESRSLFKKFMKI